MRTQDSSLGESACGEDDDGDKFLTWSPLSLSSNSAAAASGFPPSVARSSPAQGRDTPELREQVHQYRAELLRLLAEPWDADQAEELLRVTLTAIEVVVHHQSGAVLQRVADLITNTGQSSTPAFPTSILNRSDTLCSTWNATLATPLPAAATTTNSRPRLARSATAHAARPTIGIVRCGACFPDAGARRAKYARTR